MELNDLSRELKEFTETAANKIAEQNARLLQMEQKMCAPNAGGGENQNDIGSVVTNSAQFKSFKDGNYGKTGRIPVGSFHTKTTVVNATGLNQPLVPAFYRPGVIAPGMQPLRIRDILPSFQVNSNMVEYVKETSSTNAAAMQTAEGTAKAESALGFTLSYAPVQTLAHWIPASRQVLDDAQALQGYINQRLGYFLKLKEEDELLNGSGTGVELSGLITNATPYDLSYTNVATDTFIDILGHALDFCFDNSNFEADAIVLNNRDWGVLRQIKTTGTASSGQYIFSDPHAATTPQLWGVPVVVTKSIPRGQFLVGNFQMAAAIWDRNGATIEISREHADFFTRNLVAILTEERLALTVFRSDALIFGGFPFGS